MTDRDVEQRLRAWYEDVVDEDEAAPHDLRAQVAAIPATEPAPLRPLPRRRGVALLAVAALLLVGGTIAAGSDLWRMATRLPTPSVAVIATGVPSSAPSNAPTPAATVPLRNGDVIAYTGLIKDDTSTCFFERPCTAARLSIVGVDGQGAREVFPGGTGHQLFMDWTPDGSRLLYSEDGRLFMVDPRGGSAQPVDTGCTSAPPRTASSCVQDSQAAFSRDGRHIVFVRNFEATTMERAAIATMDLETGQVTQLVSTSPDGGVEPRLSPDGSQVVFYRFGTKDVSGPGAIKSGLFVMDTEGTNLHQVSPPAMNAIEPDWSPDGQRIAFLSPTAGANEGFGDLYTIHPDGSGLQRLTTDGAAEAPTWTPDGRILFARIHLADHSLAGWWTMDADGSNAALQVPASALGLGQAGGSRAAWQPLGGAAIAPLPWTPIAAVDVGPPPPTPSPTPTPDLAPGFSWTGPPTTSDGSPLGETATLLKDGRVLVTAGCGTTAELYDPATGTFAPTGSLTVVRAGKTATLLRDGRVLFTGGYNCARAGEDGIWRSAELYDPATGTFQATGAMTTPREQHTATLLADGRVLLTGGITGPQPLAAGGVTLASIRTADTSSNVLATAEIYDPTTGTFRKAGSMNAFRNDHTATLLEDGRVLVVGGGGEGYASRTSAELYDPATGTFTKTGSMKTGRWLQTATRLADGRVLVLGGRSPKDSVYRSAELYDPASGRFGPAGLMTEGRQQHTATLLPDGRVFIAGGYWSDGKQGRDLDSTEMYDPATETFTAVGSMGTPRSGHTATLLDDGRVLIIGGSEIGPQGSVGVGSAVLFQP